MKKILFVPIVLVLLVFCDLMVRLMFSCVYTQTSGYNMYRYSYQNFDKTCGIVILGASRARHHYDPAIISKGTGLACYNLGWDGYAVSQQYLALKKVLENDAVNLVILDISADQLTNFISWGGTHATDLYLPHYWDNADAKHLLDQENGRLHNLRYISSLVQYNKKIWDIVNDDEASRQIVADNGYFPLPYTGQPWNGKSSNLNKFEPSGEAVAYLNRIISACMQREIPCVMCISPCLGDWSILSGWLKEYAEKHQNVYFFDYSHASPFVQTPTLFKDARHLNEKGAEIFSTQLREHLTSLKLIPLASE